MPLGNGFTKDGKVAGDYLAAGADPRRPRTTNQDIETALKRLGIPK